MLKHRSLFDLTALDTPADSLVPNNAPSIDIDQENAPQDVFVSPTTNLDMSPATSSPSDPSLEQSSNISSSASRLDMDARSPLDAERASSAEVDPQILEALRSSKDRLYVLKLGEQMEALILERQWVYMILRHFKAALLCFAAPILSGVTLDYVCESPMNSIINER